MPVMTTSSSNTTREVARFFAVSGGLLIMPCMRVRLVEIRSDCSALAQDAYRRFGMRLYGFRDGYNGGAMRTDLARCSRQKLGIIARLDRAIQYAAASPHAFAVSGILDSPPSRGMTA